MLESQDCTCESWEHFISIGSNSKGDYLTSKDMLKITGLGKNIYRQAIFAAKKYITLHAHTHTYIAETILVQYIEQNQAIDWTNVDSRLLASIQVQFNRKCPRYMGKNIILYTGPNATIYMAVYVLTTNGTMPAPGTTLTTNLYWNIDGIVQERRNSSALAMELRPSCSKTSIFLKDSATSLSPLWTGDVI